MRLLQLRAAGDGPTLDLHPYLTIVQGLPPHHREVVMEAVAGLPTATDIGIDGLVEAHGVLLDLNADTLRLLDLPTSALDVHVVVRTEDLPGGGAGQVLRDLRRLQAERQALVGRADAARAELVRLAEARAAAAAALADVRHVADQAEHERRRHEEEAERLRGDGTVRAAALAEVEQTLEAARTDLGQAAADHHGKQEEVAALGEQRRGAAETCTALAASLQEAGHGLDPGAAEAIDAAERRLAALEQEAAAAAEAASAGTESEADRAADAESLHERLERLEARRAELEASLFALTAVDPTPVADALDRLRHRDQLEPVPSLEAAALADEWLDLDHELDVLHQPVEADGGALAEARRRLEDARATLQEAEQAVRLPHLDREDINALEDAHAQVLEAQERSEGRFSGGRAERRLADARRAEQEVLDRLGFATYSDFMMGTSIRAADPATEARLDEARQELSEAEDEWHSLQDSVDTELTRASLLDRRRGVRQRALELLEAEPAGDLVDSLRQLRRPALEPEEAADELRAALDGAGMAVGEEQLGSAELVDLAELWLEQEREAEPARAALTEELAAVDAELQAVHAALAQPDADGETANAALREARLDEARAALASAESRLAGHQAAHQRVAALEDQLEQAAERERQVAAELEQVAAEVDQQAEAEHRAAARVTVLESERDAAAEMERRAAEELAEVETRLEELTTSGPVAEVRQLEDDRDRAEAEEQVGADALAGLEQELAEVDRRLAEARAAEDADRAQREGAGIQPATDEVEWYLLARLAAQRSVSYAGSVPLVLDDALAGFPDADVVRLLDRLERMAAAVQVVYLSDDEVVARWVESVGPERAAVVGTGPALGRLFEGE